MPFLNTKAEYLWDSYEVNDIVRRSEIWLMPYNWRFTQTGQDVDIIRVDQKNTVETLRDQLQKLLVSGHDDAGFPVLARAKDDGGSRLVGYIGASELEHALSKSLILIFTTTNRFWRLPLVL